MADIRWIKVAVDMFEDNKIDFIRSLPEGDAIIVTWIQMLALAGQSNSGGYLMVTEGIPYTEQLLSNKLKRQPVFLQFALETLTKLKMINIDDGPYHITKWEKHQNVDGMDKVRLDTAKRVANHRAKKKKQLNIDSGNVTVTLHGNANVTPEVTQCNAIELELDLDKENNILPFPAETLIPDDRLIFEYWNSKGITKHRAMKGVMSKNINSCLKDMTVDELKEAIDNYHTVLSDKETYWYSYKFTLQDFVNPKNICRFMTENDPLENLKRSDQFSSGGRSKINRNSSVPDVEETKRWSENFERMAKAGRMRQVEMGDE